MYYYSVKSIEKPSSDTRLITLEALSANDVFLFKAGQYAAIGFKRFGRPSPMRCFSIVSSPNQRGTLQFAFKVFGDFSRALARLSPGDTVFVQGPFGQFAIDEGYHRNAIMMAGGIGITPFISMARYLSEVSSPVQLTLLYSVQVADDIPFLGELVELERRNPRFRVVFFVTGGSIDQLQGKVRVVEGRISAEHLNRLTGSRFDKFNYFICGPKSFNKGIKQLLLAADTEASSIHTEEFTPSIRASEGNLKQEANVSRWTYAFATASTIVAICFIMIIDLDRAIPKLTRAEALSPSSTSTSSTNSTSGASGSGVSSSNDTTSGSSTTATYSSTNQSYTQPTETQSYSPPVTSVS